MGSQTLVPNMFTSPVMDVFRQYKLKSPAMESIKSELPYVSLYHQYLLNQFTWSQQSPVKLESPGCDTDAPLDLNYKSAHSECSLSPPLSPAESDIYLTSSSLSPSIVSIKSFTVDTMLHNDGRAKI